MNSLHETGVPNEHLLVPSHVITPQIPKTLPDYNRISARTDSESIGPFLSDEANFPGGESPLLIDFAPDAGVSEISFVVGSLVDKGDSMVASGARTSLTGAAVPKGEAVLNMSWRKGMAPVEYDPERGYTVRVQSGVTISELQNNIGKDGLFLPAAPTYPEATVVGAISTDGAGARTYKYGKMRNFVEGLTVALPSGEALELERGRYVAHPGDEEYPAGYFTLVSNGEIRRIPVPTYEMPDVPKVSAGYYAKEGMDLVDLFVGSEGTLGVITEARIRVLPEPPTTMALVPCESDAQALELMNKLREIEPDRRETHEPGGISAVEFIGSNAVELVRSKNNVPIPEGAKAFLLVQVEEGDNESFETFVAAAADTGIDDFGMAVPEDNKTKQQFIDFRELVPITVNEQIAELKKADPAVTKIGADPCVKPEDLGKMMKIYDDLFSMAGIRYFVWGHGEGNLHYNALPENEDQVAIAKRVIERAGQRIIEELEGTGTAEHGIGKNEAKQALLLHLYGETGIAQMRMVKHAFDPNGSMAPGNIFPVRTNQAAILPAYRKTPAATLTWAG